MMQNVETGEINPEDRQIIEKLAKLQEMYDLVSFAILSPPKPLSCQ